MCLREIENKGHSVWDFVEKRWSFGVSIQKYDTFSVFISEKSGHLVKNFQIFTPKLNKYDGKLLKPLNAREARKNFGILHKNYKKDGTFSMDCSEKGGHWV